MASLTLPTTSGLQIATRAIMRIEDSDAASYWLQLRIDLGASGSASLFLDRTGIANWQVKANRISIIASGEFRYKSDTVSTGEAFDINFDWADAGVSISIDGLPYVTRESVSFPLDFKGAEVDLSTGLFGGSGQDILGIDYIEITSPGDSAPEAFWTDFQQTLEVV